MGIWEFIGSTAETVKRNAPDTTSLKNVFTTPYGYSYTAFNKIDQAVRTNNLDQWIPDNETRSKIGLYTAKFAENASIYAIQEGYKLVPGGVAFSNIVSKTLNDVKHETLTVQKLDKSAEKIGTPQKQWSGEVSDGAGTVKPAASDDDGHIVKRPEDVIRIFMMKEYFGTRFFDDLMVADLATRKGKKKPDHK